MERGAKSQAEIDELKAKSAEVDESKAKLEAFEERLNFLPPAPPKGVELEAWRTERAAEARRKLEEVEAELWALLS